ncbi:MAG: ATP-dependent DNA helicase RecG, partial [Pseudomonadales bacterium]
MGSELSAISVTDLKGVGVSLAAKLAKLGIASVQDLLFHLPFRYEDRTRVTPIGAARPGQTYVLQGKIVASDIVFGRRRSLLAYLQDGTGKIGLRFYHFSKAQEHNLKNAGDIRCYGEVRQGASGFEIYHPEYASLDQAAAMETSLTPIYPATEGFSQARYRALAEQALALLDSNGMADINLEDSPHTSMPIADALRF